MKFSISIKKLFASPLFFGGKALNLSHNRYNEKFVILMYHRIINKNTSETYLQDGMYVDPKTFTEQIKFLKKYFDILPLEKVLDLKNIIRKKSTKRPICILTFDDGWKDFFEYAFPILKSNDVCATVFLPTDFIGTTQSFWTDDLARILYSKNIFDNNKNKENLSKHEIVFKIHNLIGSIETKIENAITMLKTLPVEEIKYILKELEKKWEMDTTITGRSFLSWEEIKEMYRSGIIFFGSHTKSHQILTTITENMVRDELIISKNKLLAENVVSPSFIPFVYPNGNYTKRIAELVEEEGYNLGLTTEKGWNHVMSNREGLYQLKRIGIHQDITSTNGMLACRIMEIY